MSTSLFLDHPQLKTSVLLNTLDQSFFHLFELCPLPAFSWCPEVKLACIIITTACRCLQTICKDCVKWRNQSSLSFVWALCWLSSPPFFAPVLFLFLLCPVILLNIWVEGRKTTAIVNCLQRVFSLSPAHSISFFLLLFCIGMGLCRSWHKKKCFFLDSFEVLQHCAGSSDALTFWPFSHNLN